MARDPFPIDPDDPLAPARGESLDGLLALLERLDGVEEAAVVRSALSAGVSRERVLAELQREVERRLLALVTRSGAAGPADPGL
jgi:hypothetical protein